MPVGGPNLFGLTEYDNKTSFFGDSAPLSQAVGYPLVLGVAAAFVLLTVGLFWLDRHYAGTEYDSEHFNTAGRRIKTGLISVDIVSHWCWSSTILQSANQAWLYGVTGPYWYAGAAIVQILCFGIIAVYIKKRASTAHTVLEIVWARWGNASRVIFFYFLVVTSIVVAGQLILGGSAVINALTGMNIYAAIFLIPFSVVLYTSTGGLKSTFVSSYVHTVVIYIVLLIFCFTVYAASDKIGSPSKMYDRLVLIAKATPVAGNRGGSFLTFWSESGVKFGILQTISCWGITIVDQAYWQSAIAARPAAAWKGYIIGGLLWFAIPFGFATSLGLTVRAMDLPLTATEAGSGLVPPAAAVALLGKGGAIMIVLIILMAITSSGSAEMVAISSLVTYDIYKPFFRPKADGKHLLIVSRIMVAFYGLVMACVSVIFYKANINLNFLYFLMATATTSAVPPLASSVMWARCSKVAALSGAIIGQALGVAAWLVEAHIEYGVLNTTTLQEIGPALTGGCFSLFGSLIITVGLSYFFPQNYDWTNMKSIAVFNDISGDKAETAAEETPEELRKIERRIWVWAGSLTVVFLFAWPLLALPAGVFSKGYFTFWVVLSLIWALIATVLATFLPIVEAWRILAVIAASVFPCIPGLKDVAAKNQPHSLDTESPSTPVKDVPLPVEKPT